MITKDPQTFFVNAHKCEVRYEHREHYTGWVSGEKITSGGNPNHVRSTLIRDAKYREQGDADFHEVAEAVLAFLKRQKDDGYLWVYNDVVMDYVTPQNSVGPAYSALLQLESIGVVEEGNICMDLNVEQMWRATGKDIEEPEELSAWHE